MSTYVLLQIYFSYQKAKLTNQNILIENKKCY